jgi:hypothetical protein
MQTDPHDHDPSPSPESERDLPRTLREATGRLDAHRDKLRGLVKEMDQEVADAEQRRSDREGNDKG